MAPIKLETVENRMKLSWGHSLPLDGPRALCQSVYAICHMPPSHIPESTVMDHVVVICRRAPQIRIARWLGFSFVFCLGLFGFCCFVCFFCGVFLLSFLAFCCYSLAYFWFCFWKYLYNHKTWRSIIEALPPAVRLTQPLVTDERAVIMFVCVTDCGHLICV